MKLYSPIQSIAACIPAGLRKGIAITLIGSAAAAHLLMEESSYNLARHLKNPSSIDFGNSHHAAIEFLRQYRQPIIDNSKRYSVPLELVAATIKIQNQNRTFLEDVKDWLATEWRAYYWNTYVSPKTQNIPLLYKPRFLDETNPSLGPGQVQVCTAAALDRKFGIEPIGREALEEILQNPHENIMYMTLAWADLMSQRNRLPPVPKANILDYPELVAVLGTEYIRGTTGTELRDARPSQGGREFLHLLATTDFYAIFGEHSKITIEQQQRMKEYLKKPEIPPTITKIGLEKQKKPPRKSRC